MMILRCAVLVVSAVVAADLRCLPPKDYAGAAELVAAHNMSALAPCLLDCGSCDVDEFPLYHDPNHAARVSGQYPSLQKRLSAVANESGIVFWGDSIYFMFRSVCDTYDACANGGVGEDTWLSSLHRLWMLCSSRPNYVFVLLGVYDQGHKRVLHCHFNSSL